ncbi:MAG: histidine phosphatase family protein [Ilumatobacteraceae bacterium]
MTRLHLVRHGRAAAGWNVDPDPPLDDQGRAQALSVAQSLSGLTTRTVLSSPLLRCQQTAFPLAASWGVEVRIEPGVAEIPSPEGFTVESRGEWLREVMAGTWTQAAEKSGVQYSRYCESVAETLRAVGGDAVVFSHYIAINAAIGHALGDDRVVVAQLDNCSVTVIDVRPDGTLELVEIGGQADTVVR